MRISQTIITCFCTLLLTSCAVIAAENTVRFATLNIAMGLPEEGQLAQRLADGKDTDLQKIAAIIQQVRPDVVLLSEFDHDGNPQPPRDFIKNYLEVPQNGGQAISYGYHFSAEVNTGVDSGMDLDRNGKTGDPADAWGYGVFAGQYGMLLLSRFEIDHQAVRTFKLLKRTDMPGALVPRNPDGSPWHDEETWNALRLSSKSHWDIPLNIDGVEVHFLASHPTPTVFDGPEDRNGIRNHVEIRFWADYVGGNDQTWIRDDRGTRGGLRTGAAFVIAGDQNADPVDGDSVNHSIMQLLGHERINTDCTPRSKGALEATEQQAGVNLLHQGDPATDTADFNDQHSGNLRVDYVLPSESLPMVACGVFWPAADEIGADWITASDHRLVWVDVRMPVR